MVNYEFLIYTLSFKEMLMFKAEQQHALPSTLYSNFDIFLRMGGFPAIHTAAYTSETAYKIVHDIYSSVILRDAVQRYSIRDVELLERVVKFVFDNIGNKFSAKNVADYFKSQNNSYFQIILTFSLNILFTVLDFFDICVQFIG